MVLSATGIIKFFSECASLLADLISIMAGCKDVKVNVPNPRLGFGFVHIIICAVVLLLLIKLVFKMKYHKSKSENGEIRHEKQKKLRNREVSCYWVAMIFIIAVAIFSRDTLKVEAQQALSVFLDSQGEERRSESESETEAGTEHESEMTVETGDLPSPEPQTEDTESGLNIYQTSLGEKYMPQIFQTMPVGTKDELQAARNYLNSLEPARHLEESVSITEEERKQELEIKAEIEKLNPQNGGRVLAESEYYEEADYYQSLSELRPVYDNFYQQGRATMEGMAQGRVFDEQSCNIMLAHGCDALQCFEIAETAPGLTSAKVQTINYQKGQVYHHMADVERIALNMRVELYYFAAEYYEYSTYQATDEQMLVNAKYNQAMVLYKANNLMEEQSDYLLKTAWDLFQEVKTDSFGKNFEVTRYLEEINLKTNNRYKKNH